MRKFRSYLQTFLLLSSAPHRGWMSSSPPAEVWYLRWATAASPKKWLFPDPCRSEETGREGPSDAARLLKLKEISCQRAWRRCPKTSRWETNGYQHGWMGFWTSHHGEVSIVLWRCRAAPATQNSFRIWPSWTGSPGAAACSHSSWGLLLLSLLLWMP